MSGAQARLARVKNEIVLAMPTITNTLLPGITLGPIRARIPPKNTITVGNKVGGRMTDKINAAKISTAGSLKHTMPAMIHIVLRNFWSLLGRFFQPCCTNWTNPVCSSIVGNHSVWFLHRGQVGLRVVWSQLTKQNRCMRWPHSRLTISFPNVSASSETAPNVFKISPPLSFSWSEQIGHSVSPIFFLC